VWLQLRDAKRSLVGLTSGSSPLLAGQRCFFCHDARKPSGSIGTYTVFLWFEQSLDLNKFLAGHDTVLASFGSAGLSDLARYCQVLDQKQISSANLLKTVEAISTWP
jgi:hypothetical protein